MSHVYLSISVRGFFSPQLCLRKRKYITTYSWCLLWIYNQEKRWRFKKKAWHLRWKVQQWTYSAVGSLNSRWEREWDFFPIILCSATISETSISSLPTQWTECRERLRSHVTKNTERRKLLFTPRYFQQIFQLFTKSTRSTKKHNKNQLLNNNKLLKL